MKDYVSQRLRYFNGQFLDVNDFTDEQAYHLNRRRLHNQHLHTSGIIEGLEVEKEDSKKIRVKAGMALDSWGREIILNDDIIKDIKDITPSDGLICVWIEYCEVKIKNQDDADANTATRVEEKAIVKVSSNFPDEPGNNYVRLAIFTLDNQGNIPNNDNGKDLDGVNGVKGDKSEVQPVKVFSGAKLADRSVSVSELKTELCKEGKVVITPDAPYQITVRETLFDSTESNASDTSAHLIVFASLASFQEGASFSWTVKYACIDEKGVKKRTQNVIFVTNNTNTNGVTIKFKIYALLE